jgi:hypothetical protein
MNRYLGTSMYYVCSEVRSRHCEFQAKRRAAELWMCQASRYHLARTIHGVRHYKGRVT